MSEALSRYPSNSPTPNWPISLNLNKFSHYCDPVQTAVFSALQQREKVSLKNTLSQRNPLSQSEKETIHRLYSEAVDIIHMKSEAVT